MDIKKGFDYIKLAGAGDQLVQAVTAKDDEKIGSILKYLSDSQVVRDRKLHEEIKMWIADNPAEYFRLPQLRDEFHVRDEASKANLRQIIKRLTEEGVIEPTGRPSEYARIGDDLKEMRWWESSTNNLPLKLPFEMHEHVKIFGGNIIVYAGAPQSGKTAAVLATIVMNLNNVKLFQYYAKYMKKMKNPDALFYVLNSESGGPEVKERIYLIRDLDIDDFVEKCIIYERVENFHRAIKPNMINFIDFMEIHTDYWLVGKMLLDIHKKLDQGICFVCLQMNKDEEYGLGKSRGLEKPRLYCTFDHGNFLIVKAKNWMTDVNPNYLGTTYKLVNGNEFIYSPLMRSEPRTKVTTKRR